MVDAFLISSPEINALSTSAVQEPNPVLSLESIVKDFPGVRALSSVNLNLYAGEVTALVGENGAGKSGKPNGCFWPSTQLFTYTDRISEAVLGAVCPLV